MIDVMDKIRNVLEVRDFEIMHETENNENNKYYIYCKKITIIYTPDDSALSLAFHVDLQADAAVLLTLHLQSELRNFVQSVYILDSYIYDEKLNYLTGEIAYKKLEQFKKNSNITDYLMKEQEDLIMKFGKFHNC